MMKTLGTVEQYEEWNIKDRERELNKWKGGTRGRVEQ